MQDSYFLILKQIEFKLSADPIFAPRYSKKDREKPLAWEGEKRV